MAIYVLGLGLGLASLALGETVSSSRLVAHVWLRENGLPQNRVTAVKQTRDGYVWVGTYNGLARFDGERFAVYNNANTSGMSSSGVTSLFEAKDGALWIGHENGQVTRYLHGEFKPVAIKAKWSPIDIVAIGSDESGDVWLLNKDGVLVRLRDGLTLTAAAGSMGPWIDMAKSGNGKIWVLRNGKVSVLQDGELRPLAFDFGDKNTLVLGIGAGRDGSLWVAAHDYVARLKAGAWIEDRTLGAFAGTPCDLVEIKEGILAATTTDKGFQLMFPDQRTEVFDRSNGLASDWVTAFHEDQEGSLWVGTGGAGLALIRQSCLQNISPPDAWQGRAVLSVCGDVQGAIWVGTEGMGLYRFQNGSWTNYAVAAGLANPYVWSVTGDQAGNFWAGTWGAGLFVRRGERFEPASGLEQVTAPITALLAARQGGLWVGTSTGLLHYDGAGKFSWLEEQHGLADSGVRCVTENREGVVWFGTAGEGLFRWQAGVLKSFRKTDGLPSDSVQCLAEDASGAIWIGTYGRGLCRFKAGRFNTIDEKQGLPDNVICDIEDDGHGYFWMSSYNGIIRVSQAELNECADGTKDSIDCLNYGMSDGMPTLECSGRGCKTADGRLWFTTSRGLVAVNPLAVKTNPLPPPVVIEKLLVDGEPVAGGAAPTGRLKIPPGRHRLEFQYAGLSFAAPEKVVFKHRLDGLDTDWIKVGAKRTADYNYIPPGKYTFRVIACNNDGVWNETGAALAFTVLPYFWQTAWFQALSLVGLIFFAGGGAWFGTRHRMRRKLERVERQRSLERERARIAKDIHDDLGASLTRINLLSQSARRGMDDEPQTVKNLDQICRTARQLTRAMDEIVWAVDPQHDTLDSLASYLGKLIHELLGDSGIRCRLDFPVYLPVWPVSAEIRHNLFLAFKEALHNVLKHSNATEVRISLSLKPAAVLVNIQDNGCGFDLVPREGGPPPSRGNGLVNMRQRLQEIGGHCEIQNQPGQGLRVTFIVPRTAAVK